MIDYRKLTPLGISWLYTTTPGLSTSRDELSGLGGCKRKVSWMMARGQGSLAVDSKAMFSTERKEPLISIFSFSTADGFFRRNQVAEPQVIANVWSCSDKKRSFEVYFLQGQSFFIVVLENRGHDIWTSFSLINTLLSRVNPV